MANKQMKIAIEIAGKVASSFGSTIKRASGGIRSISTAASKMTGTVANATKKTAKVLGGITAATSAATAAIGAAAVNVGSEFEKSMSQVSATMLLDKETEKGKKDYKILEEAARECGRNTAFSASQASDALNYLALAGYNAKDAAKTLPTVLNLAGAGGMELADASNMITDAMSALGKTVKAEGLNVEGFADKMAMTASKSNTSVAELGSAILQIGGTANTLSGGTTELNTALGLLADNGIHAAEGGTKLRNMIKSLTSPTDKASKMLEKLGISAEDSKGNMRPLKDIMGDFGKEVGSMGKVEKNATLAKIFNAQDLKAVNALIDTSGKRWDELSKAIDDSKGACEDMYKTQEDNLKGDLKQLSAAMEDLGISIYKDVGGPLRDTVQFATKMVGKLSKAYDKGGMSGMIKTFGTVAAEGIASAAKAAPKAIRVGTQMLQSLAKGIEKNKKEIFKSFINVVAELGKGTLQVAPQFLSIGASLITELGKEIVKKAPEMITIGTKVIENIVAGISTMLPQLFETGANIMVYLAGKITQYLPKLIEIGSKILLYIANGFVQQLPQLAQAAMMLIQSLISMIQSNLPNLMNAGIDILNYLVLGIKNNLPNLIATAMEALVTFSGSLRNYAGKLVDVGLKLIMTLADSFIANIPVFIRTIPTIIINLCGIINDNAPKLLAAGLTLIVKLGAGLIQAIPVLIANLPKIIQAIVSVFMAFNWLSLGRKIITIIKYGVKGVATAIPELFKKIGSKAKKVFHDIHWKELGTKVIKFIVNGIKSLVKAIPDALKNIAKEAWDAFKSINWIELGSGIISSVISGITSAGKGLWGTITGLFTGEKADTSISKAPVQSASEGKANFTKAPIQTNTPWHAAGGIFRRPTILKSASGFQGVGEAGAEAILPLSTLWEQLDSAIDRTMGDSHSMVVQLLQRLQNGQGNKTREAEPQLAGYGDIVYSPTYQIYGATKEDVAEAGKTSQEEFARWMKKLKKEEKRRNLRG